MLVNNTKIYRNLSWQNRNMVIALAMLIFLDAGISAFLLTSYTPITPATFAIMQVCLMGFVLLLGAIGWFTGVEISEEGITGFGPLQKKKFLKWGQVQAIKCLAVNKYSAKEINPENLDKTWWRGPRMVYLFTENFNFTNIYDANARPHIAFVYRKDAFAEVIQHLDARFRSENRG